MNSICVRKRHLVILMLTLAGMLVSVTVDQVQAYEYYDWPAYSPTVAYDYFNEYGPISQPTEFCPDGVTGIAGSYVDTWWCFRWGSNKNPLVTEDAWIPMLQRFNQDFDYITDIMRWPRDKRALEGYYSTIYLFGSGLSTDNAGMWDTGGWQSSAGGYPMVLASYYPVYCFDPACTYGDKVGQQGAMIHEGIHCILSSMPGCFNACWFHEGGNTWLQGTMGSQRSGNFNSLGWLSAGAAIAPFMPIECYSGWLQDDSFGGPCAEGVYQGDGICTWRNLLGGTQYGECFPHAMEVILGPKSIAWVWRYASQSGRVLQDLAQATGGLGTTQIRRLIKEYRGRQAFCDFGPWSYAFRQLLNNNWNLAIEEEYPPYWIDCDVWYATCYVLTTQDGSVLTPEYRTLPGWSGANQIPLTINPSATEATVMFNPIGSNMSCQLVYRDTSGNIHYGVPVSSGTCGIPLANVMNNVIVAVICNTDYIYYGESTRTAKYDYTLTMGAGITGKADIYTKWYDYNPSTYTITASAGANGSISPSGNVVVNAGGNQTFTFDPDPDYQVDQVILNGLPIGAMSSYTFNDVRGNHTISVTFTGGGPDTEPPTPNPATWATVPYAVSSSQISMTATTGSDASPPVQYYFDETSGNPGGSDSGWQISSTYNDTGLSPNTQYTYTVKMRDSLLNTGTASSPASATTQAGTEITDDFSAAHNYLTEGVSGTIWDGFVGLGTDETVDNLNANTTVAGQLYVQSTNGRYQEPWTPLGPFLYRNVSGDFVATVKVTGYQDVLHNNCGIMARASMSPDEGGTGEDWVSMDYFPIWSCGNFVRSANDGVRTEHCNNGLAFNLDPYLQIERSGNVFHFSTSANGTNWTEMSCSPLTRTDLDSLTLQVGLFQATYSDSQGYVAFDDFKLTMPSGPDTDPPTPNPATWATVPYAVSNSEISMTATTGSDASPPVEYYFDETTGNPGGTDSGWITNPTYNDTGLNPDTQYTYTVTMRDSLLNTGSASSPASATTGSSVVDHLWNGSTNEWTTSTNWYPAGVPQSGDFIVVNESGPNPVISTSGQACSDLYVGSDGSHISGWSDPSPGNPVLTVSAAGSLTVASILRIGDTGSAGGSGTLTINGGTVTSGGVYIGFGGNGYMNMNSGNWYPGHIDIGMGMNTGTFNMNGGYVECSAIAVGAGNVDTGYFYLDGGTVYCTNTSSGIYTTSGATGVMDITEGTLILNGDQRIDWDNFVNDSATTVTAYSGSGTINVDYNITNPGKTTITASPTADTDPPTPNPATWATVPYAVSSSEISMTATTGSDASPPVEYYFDETTGNPGGSDSGWVTNPTYNDTGLQAGTQYTYRVRMRDSLLNTGNWSTSESATTPSGGQVFYDSFENGEWNGLWTEDSQADWFDSYQRATQGSYSAEVDGYANNATLTSIVIDLQGNNDATVTFDWFIESGLDTGEYLAFDVSTDGGTQWTQKAILQGNVDQENVWHNESIDVTNITSGNLRIRFRGKMSLSSEDADADNVKVVSW